MQTALFSFLVFCLICPAIPVQAAANRPDDFYSFWAETGKELSQIPLESRIEAAASNQPDDDVVCRKVSYRSLNSQRVHAWYCYPAGRPGPFPAILISPWFGQGAIDVSRDINRKGFAILSYQARGFEVDQPSYPPQNGDYIREGIDDAKTYAYRQIVANGLQGLAFLKSRPEIDKNRIGTAGASQGGALSLILAALDPRIRAAAANFPYLCNLVESVKKADDSPYSQIQEYIKDHSGSGERVLNTLSYFDVLNFAASLRIPVLVQRGLKDTIAPASDIAIAFDAIPSTNKKLLTYPNAAHADNNDLRRKDMFDFLENQLSR